MPDAPSRADHRRAEVEAAHGEVLAERPGLDRTAQLLGPPLVVLDRVRVDRLVGATVHAQVGLLVTVEVDAPHRDPPVDGRLPDAGLDLAPVPLDGAYRADVHRHHDARPHPGHGRQSRERREDGRTLDARSTEVPELALPPRSDVCRHAVESASGLDDDDRDRMGIVMHRDPAPFATATGCTPAELRGTARASSTLARRGNGRRRAA